MFRRKRDPDDFDAEIEAHLKLETERLQEQGLSYEEARAAAHRAFGNVTRVRERFYESGRWVWWEQFRQNVRYGLRMLRKAPGFTLVAVLTLALGIGATTAIFSLVYAAMLRPLPYTDPGRLMHLGIRWKSGYINDNVTPAMADAVMRHSRSFESFAMTFPSTGCNLSGGGSPEFVPDRRVNADFFRTLGVRPILGRTFLAEDAVRGNSVLLSYRLWKTHFQGDPGVLGSVVWCNGAAQTVVGVLPPNFRFLKPTDVWLPGRLPSYSSDSGMNYLLIARLRAGVTTGSAAAELQGIFQQVRAEYPGAFTSKSLGYALGTFRQWSSSELSTPLWFLFGAVLLVLLIACANVAALLLARSSARRREMAVRVALGARRSDIVRQLLTESLLLNLLGAAAGVVLAWWCLNTLKTIVPARAEIFSFNEVNLAAIGLNLPTLWFTLAIAFLTTLISGLGPALGTFGHKIFETLKSGERGGTGSAAQQRGRMIAVAAQVALAVVLLGCSALLVRSFLAMQAVDLGFNPRGLHVAEISMSSKKYAGQGSIWRFDQQVIERIRALPGVLSVATASSAPLQPGLNLGSPIVDGKQLCGGGAMDYRGVSPRYFDTMGMRIISGREIADSDVSGSTPVVVVNRAAARECWNGQNPIGTQFWAWGLTTHEKPVEVVGIVDDVREYAVNLPSPPVVYVPQAQASTSLDDDWYRSFGLLSAILIRTSGDSDLSVDVPRAVQEVDPQQPVVSVAPMSSLVGESIAFGRMLMLLMSAFAALALILTSIGLYGLLNYQVTQRTREIGIRMALGAGARQVMSMVVRQGLLLVASGTLAGIAGALAAARLLKSQIYGVSPTDPWTFVVATVILACVAALASYVPVRRATHVEPSQALRSE